MNADEMDVCDFLQDYHAVFVSVTEISRRLGKQRKFQKDRAWARPILRRMELDGILESNQCGEYRLKASANQPTTFKKALTQPGASLGDTTIISLDDEEDTTSEDVNAR